MRCPDCNKFVSHEVEVNDVESDLDASAITATVTITLGKNCVECDTPLATATVEVEEDIAEEVRAHSDSHTDPDEVEFCIEHTDPDIEEEGSGRNLHYRVYGSATVSCEVPNCEWAHTFSFSDTVHTGDFDEC